MLQRMQLGLLLFCLAASPARALCPAAYYDNARGRVVLPLVVVDARDRYRVELELGTNQLQAAAVETAQGGMDLACAAHFDSASWWLEVPEFTCITAPTTRAVR